MKTTYLVITEKGRVRGRTSGSVIKISESENKLITELDYNSASNRGQESEAIAKLVEIGELPIEALSNPGYINYDYKKDNYDLILVEGQGLTYFSIQ